MRSYRTFSPLPRSFAQNLGAPKILCEWAGRYVFCGTFRPPPFLLRVRIKLSTERAGSRTLSGTLLCGVRTFLPGPFPPRLQAEAALLTNGPGDRPVQPSTANIIDAPANGGIQAVASFVVGRRSPAKRGQCLLVSSSRSWVLRYLISCEPSLTTGNSHSQLATGNWQLATGN